jgi:hypothetical protein
MIEAVICGKYRVRDGGSVGEGIIRLVEVGVCDAVGFWVEFLVHFGESSADLRSPRRAHFEGCFGAGNCPRQGI